MTRVDRYDHQWLESRGCALDIPPEPTYFELGPSDFSPQILVGPRGSVVWLWLWIKSLSRQTIESISFTLPWVKVLFERSLNAFKSPYPNLYIVLDVSEYG